MFARPGGLIHSLSVPCVVLNSNGFGRALSFHIFVFALSMQKWSGAVGPDHLRQGRVVRAGRGSASILVGGHSGTGEEGVSWLCGHFH